MFPSPFGVHVLKCCLQDDGRRGCALVSVPFRGSRSETLQARLSTTGRLQVSVPFRGSRSEIVDSIAATIGTDVSVPFRGSRSEIVLVFGAFVLFGQFPSPFGVHVLKF